MSFTKQPRQDNALAYPKAAPFASPSPCGYRLGDLAYTAMRIAIGVIFIWSGAVKLLDHRYFAVIIDAYGIIPEAAAAPAALFLSLLELLAGLGLMWDFRGSLSMITAMLVLFMAILGYGLWMGLDVDCGCFGPGDPEAEAFHGLRPALYRDMVMLAGIGYLFFWRQIGSIRPRKLSNFNLFKTERRQKR